jgi:predicted O-methyltransferase YrrM
LFVVPKALRDEHVKECRLYADRIAMLRSFRKGGVWVEVGTAAGAFAGQILEICQPRELHLIDVDFNLVRKDKHVSESDRVTFHQGFSWDVLQSFPDDYFDFIYIDANHDLYAVAKDTSAGMKKLNQDGVLIFNDYIIFSHVDMCPMGVVPVVNALCNDDGWVMVALALQNKMYCDVALRRVAAMESGLPRK